MTSYASVSPEVGASATKVPSPLRVFLLSSIVVSPNILVGFTVAFPAIALPQMKLDVNAASWFESLSILLSPLGACLIGLTIDNYGRRTALLLGLLPCTIGWFILYRNSDVSLLLISQVLIGITYGAIGYPSQVYAGECIMINHVRLRNYFATSSGVIVAFGILLIFVLGGYVTYQTLAALVGFLALTSFLLIYFFIPESPSWLHLRGKTVRARKSQEKLGIHQPILRGSASVVTPPPAQSSGDNVFRWSTMVDFLKKFKRKDVYKPFCIFSMTFILTSLSGGIAMTMYAVDIIENNYSSAENTPTPEGLNDSSRTSTMDEDSYKYSILCGALILLSNVLVSVTMVFLGVKRINVIAHAGACIGMVLLGYTTIHGQTSSFISTLHALAVCLVNFMFNFGPLNFAGAVLGDVFPIDAKGFAGGACIILSVSSAVTNKLYPYLFGNFGGNLYYGYSVLCLINSIFCYLYFPEVTDKTLDQIRDSFLSH